MLLSSYSAQEPAQPRDKAGAEAADLPACVVPQQSGKAKPGHAGFRVVEGNMPVAWCTEQQQYRIMKARKQVMTTIEAIKDSNTSLIDAVMHTLTLSLFHQLLLSFPHSLGVSLVYLFIHLLTHPHPICSCSHSSAMILVSSGGSASNKSHLLIHRQALQSAMFSRKDL